MDLTSAARPATAASPSWDDLHVLVESVSDYAILTLDTSGHVVTWNRGAALIKGYAADEIVGQHFSKFFPAEDVARGKPEWELEQAIAHGKVEDEGWRVRKDGTLFWANVVITALRDERGNLRGFGKVTRDLTERRKTEDALRRAEERFHHLVDAATDYAIFLLDAEGRVETWNTGARKIKGYDEAEIVGKHFSLFYTAEDRLAGKPGRILEEVTRQGRFEDESWRVRKDGSRFWANVVITALRDKAGNVTGFAKVTRDLTERRNAEETARSLVREQAARVAAEDGERRLRESETRYRALSARLEITLEGVADGITVQDATGKLVFANSAAAVLWGYPSARELAATPLLERLARFELWDESGRSYSAEQLPGWRVVNGEPSASAVLRVREKETGRQWWSHVRSTAVTDPDGQTSMAVNIWHDITAERRQDEHDHYLNEATAKLASSLDDETMLGRLAEVLVPGLGDWCTVYLLEGDELRNVAVAHRDPAKVASAQRWVRDHRPRTDAERGVGRVARTGRAEVLNDIPDGWLVEAARSSEHLAAIRDVGVRTALVLPIRARDRVIGAISLLSNESGRLYDDRDLVFGEELGRRTGIAVDNARLYASAQTAAEQAAAAARRAEDASRIKDEFLATVSHELRTPLNAIVGWSSLLLDRSRGPSVQKGVEVIHRNALAQAKIIDDILDVSRIITGKLRLEPKPADLTAVVRDALDVVRPSALAKRITISIEVQPDIPALVADPDRLQQVAWNLLSNAIKFTEPEGSVRVGVEQEGSSLVLSVTDSGKGIEPEFLPYVFDRFKQADGSTTRRIGGLGLGLAIVRHLVELHGGYVEASSAGRGRGATFRVVLPVRAVAPAVEEPDAATTSLPQPETSDDAALCGLRVLLVDDEEDARELLETVLVDAGAVVETAGSVDEAVEALRRFDPHVLVSDIGMPDEDGYSLMRRARSELGARVPPSIALTAYTRPEDRMKALSVGFTTHIAKPVSPADLLSAVGNLGAFVAR